MAAPQHVPYQAANTFALISVLASIHQLTQMQTARIAWPDRSRARDQTSRSTMQGTHVHAGASSMLNQCWRRSNVLAAVVAPPHWPPGPTPHSAVRGSERMPCAKPAAPAAWVPRSPARVHVAARDPRKPIELRAGLRTSGRTASSTRASVRPPAAGWPGCTDRSTRPLAGLGEVESAARCYILVHLLAISALSERPTDGSAEIENWMEMKLAMQPMLE